MRIVFRLLSNGTICVLNTPYIIIHIVEWNITMANPVYKLSVINCIALGKRYNIILFFLSHFIKTQLYFFIPYLISIKIFLPFCNEITACIKATKFGVNESFYLLIIVYMY